MPQQVNHIVNTYKGLISGGKKANPFVVAFAKVQVYTMVTEETGIGSIGKVPTSVTPSRSTALT
ncbi:hypothetical protein [Bradyrhizobium mercantei]|uniref:hypothetical protein n=1 Tax=Bradyrhizobium mercantei TaxID=1904807 RepID=UPI00097640A0|nr:hypothetical protein [Bradyrhizobium mercantei]